VSGEGDKSARGHTGRRGGGGRTRGLWHPGSKVQWCLEWCEAGKAGKVRRPTSEDTAGAGAISGSVEGGVGARGRGRTYLSHLSLLFLQGSQLMALRARFVGGRGSWSPGGGLVRERTEGVVVDAGRCCFGRGAEDEGGSALVSSGMDGY
jgi:hypothetical protein